MNRSYANPPLTFRLSAPTRTIAAEVELRSEAGRWICESEPSGHKVTGIGATPRAAVAASLQWLGSAVLSELLADLQLLDVSWQLRRVGGR